MTTAEEVILEVMRHHGFRRHYVVAEYFGVTPQTLSGWVKANSIPPKHFMKYEKEISLIKGDEPGQNTIYVNIPQGIEREKLNRKNVPASVFVTQIIKGNKFREIQGCIYSNFSKCLCCSHNKGIDH